jgi:hypothetical protein
MISSYDVLKNMHGQMTILIVTLSQITINPPISELYTNKQIIVKT